jgi:hypothetical protein
MDVSIDHGKVKEASRKNKEAGKDLQEDGMIRFGKL